MIYKTFSIVLYMFFVLGIFPIVGSVRRSQLKSVYVELNVPWSAGASTALGLYTCRRTETLWKYCIFCLCHNNFHDISLKHDFDCILYDMFDGGDGREKSHADVCRVCDSGVQVICFLPCRHTCCRVCAAFFSRCPFCRSPLKQFCRFLMSPMPVDDNCRSTRGISKSSKFFGRVKSFSHVLDFHSSVEYARKGYYCSYLSVICSKCNIQHSFDSSFSHRLNCPLESRMNNILPVGKQLMNVDCLTACAMKNSCVVCFVNTRNCILLPCSHFALCFVCFTLENASCPICSQPYANAIIGLFNEI